MKHLNPNIACMTLLASCGLMSFQASAVLNLTSKDNPNFIRKMQTAQPVRDFKGDKPFGVWNFGNNESEDNILNTRGAVKDPAVSYDGLGSFDFLEGPDNTTWFYTVEYEKDYYEVSEWYTEEFIKAYKFTIYDSSFNEVGTISDQVALQPGESKVAYAVLDPSLSRHFFNDDDNVEAMVYLAVNTGAEFGYEVHYYNKVYSIGGKKDAEGYDDCITVLTGRCVDALNVAGGDDSYYTFVVDVYPDPDGLNFGNYDDYIKYVNSVKSIVTVYTKGDNGEPKVAFEKDVFLSCYPGDTTDGIYLITLSEKGKPYFVFSYYEKPYFVDPTGFATDESATPDNNLVIETLTYADGKVQPVSTTKIPVEIPVITGQVAYNFYSIGSLGWKNDIDTKVNGTINAPAYVVARDYTTAANLEEVESSYFVYGNDGKMIHKLAENADGLSILNSKEGDQPHAMFVLIDEKGNYTFRFVDLYSGEQVFTLNQENNGDPLTAVCQRVVGKDGKYKYAFELEYDGLDEWGNDLKRIAWYNQDGSFDRIDEINMGKNVMYATINMYPECLSPVLFDTDDAMEYAVLVKRAVGYTTRNEFLVVDDNGDRYAHFTVNDGRGDPVMFTILTNDNLNCLQMVYSDRDKLNVDVYYLPFVSTSGIESITDGLASSAGFYDGDSVIAEGCHIEVYNTAGAKMTAGEDAVSLSALSKGIYIAKVVDKDGKVSSFKLVK